MFCSALIFAPAWIAKRRRGVPKLVQFEVVDDLVRRRLCGGTARLPRQPATTTAAARSCPRMWPTSESGNTSASGSAGSGGRRRMPAGSPCGPCHSSASRSRTGHRRASLNVRSVFAGSRVSTSRQRSSATSPNRRPHVPSTYTSGRCIPAASASAVQLSKRQEPLLDRRHRRQLDAVDRVSRQPVLGDRHREHLAQYPDRLVHGRGRQICTLRSATHSRTN